MCIIINVKTVYKGKFRDLNYETTGTGLNFDTANATYEVSNNDIIFKIDNDGHIRIYKNKPNNSSKSLIVDIGENNNIGYSHVMHVRPIDFPNFSGALFQTPNGTYSQSQTSSAGSVTENAGILLQNGITGIKDITQDKCSFIIHNTQSLEIKQFVTNHSNLQLSHYNLEIDYSTGSTQRLDQEIANYNIMLTYFVLNTLNNMVLADVGTLISLPHPFILNQAEYTHCVLKTDLWFKSLSGKQFIGQYGTANGLAKKQAMFLSNGSFAYCWFDDSIRNNNRFRWHLPRTFAGWERLTNLSYITNGIYKEIAGPDGGPQSKVLIGIGNTDIGSWYNSRGITIKPVALTGTLPYSIQYT